MKTHMEEKALFLRLLYMKCDATRYTEKRRKL